jgi:hypothetical protein
MAGDITDEQPSTLNYSKGEFQAIEQTTRPIKHEGRISWQVDDFLNLARIETRMDSMPMEFRFGKSVFKFQLSLRLQVEGKPDDIGLFLTSLNDIEVKLAYNMSAIDAFGAEIKSGPVVAVASKFRYQNGWGWSKFLSKNELEAKAVDKSKSYSVKFICNFTLYLDSVSDLHKDDPEVGPKKGPRLVDATSDLWKSGLLHDFIIACEGKQFNCHKAILASRSTYFKTMFSSDWQEHIENMLDVKDANADTVGNFIEFLYTDKLSDESQFDSDLLILAERFQFETLKFACEKAISKTINLVSMLLNSLSLTLSIRQIDRWLLLASLFSLYPCFRHFQDIFWG